MADPVQAPSEKPNQPAGSDKPAAVAAVAAPVAASPSPSPLATDPKAAATVAADPKAAPVVADPKAAPAPDAAKEAEAKAAADAAAAAEAAAAAKKDEPAAPVVPETYEIKLPEELAKAGVQLDKPLIEAMVPVFKELKLSNDQAQKLASAAIAYQQGLVPRMLERDLAVTKADPELGGLKYPATLAKVNLALDAFTTPADRKWLDRAGIANRLEFVRVFERIGRAMQAAGDTGARGSPDGAPELSMADRMYGRSGKNT